MFWYNNGPTDIFIRLTSLALWKLHDYVIKWKHFPRYWPFVRGIHRSPVNSPHKGQWHGALMFSLICIWINDWVNNREAGDLGRYHPHYNAIVMCEFESPRYYETNTITKAKTKNNSKPCIYILCCPVQWQSVGGTTALQSVSTSNGKLWCFLGWEPGQVVGPALIDWVNWILYPLQDRAV